MAGIERVTVTLSDDLVRDIDRGEKNRSKFGRAEGTERRRRDELGRSLIHPHPESTALAGQGLEEWSRGLPEEATDTLVDSGAGQSVRWVPEVGWVEDPA